MATRAAREKINVPQVRIASIPCLLENSRRLIRSRSCRINSGEGARLLFIDGYKSFQVLVEAEKHQGVAAFDLEFIINNPFDMALFVLDGLYRDQGQTVSFPEIDIPQCSSDQLPGSPDFSNSIIIRQLQVGNQIWVRQPLGYNLSNLNLGAEHLMN